MACIWQPSLIRNPLSQSKHWPAFHCPTGTRKQISRRPHLDAPGPPAQCRWSVSRAGRGLTSSRGSLSAGTLASRSDLGRLPTERKECKDEQVERGRRSFPEESGWVRNGAVVDLARRKPTMAGTGIGRRNTVYSQWHGRGTAQRLCKPCEMPS